jgi:Trk-type K+ transport system membrane component
MVGQAKVYAALTNLTKVLLSLAMMLGRQEIYTILVLLVLAFWRE